MDFTLNATSALLDAITVRGGTTRGSKKSFIKDNLGLIITGAVVAGIGTLLLIDSEKQKWRQKIASNQEIGLPTQMLM